MSELSNEERYEQLKRKILTTFQDKALECVNCNSDTGTRLLQGACRELSSLIDFMKLLDGETENIEGA